MKKIYVLSLIAMVLLCSCAEKGNISVSDVSSATQITSVSSQPANQEESVSDESVTEEKSIEEELSQIDGITSVSKVTIAEENAKKNYFADSYVLTFQSPIDWHNPDLGYFSQRVFLGYKGKDKVNTYYVTGYSISDAWTADYMQVTKGSELSYHYDGNFIAMEYRFYYQSAPEDFSCQGTKYLEYLTSEQACLDFHNIMNSLQTVLSGKSIFSGGSKGGYTTETMAYYFPEDADSYISYVAPLCDGIYDTRFYDYVFTSIGNDALGEEEAGKKRDLLMSFSKLALAEESRSTYLEWLNEDLSKPDITLTGRATLDEIWESFVSETSVQTWQYDNSFTKVSDILAMSETTEEEKLAKEKAVYSYIITDLDMISSLNQQDSSTWPYYFQAYSEMGNYSYCFDYLEDAGCYITTSKEKQKDLFIRETLTEEQENHLTYSPDMRDNLIRFFDTTALDIIKIVGYSDPWYAVSAPETENPHIHLYKEKNCHRSQIVGLEEEEREACWSIIDSLVL